MSADLNLYTPANLRIANLAQGTPPARSKYLLDLADCFRSLARKAHDERGRKSNLARCEALMARVRQMSYQAQDES